MGSFQLRVRQMHHAYQACMPAQVKRQKCLCCLQVWSLLVQDAEARVRNTKEQISADGAQSLG